MSLNNIIFDLDGTLIDSRNEIISTYRQVFEQIPPHISVDPNNLNFGATLQNVLASVYGSNNELIDSAKSLFSSIYDVSTYADTTIYEGVYTTLDSLKRNGYDLHIATNKRYGPTMQILKKKDLSKFFSHIAANEMHPGVTLSKLQMIELIMKRVPFSDGFMVGDSETDIEAGKEAGLYTIGVSYGYDSELRLMNKKPTALLDSFSKLYTFVKEQSYSNHK